MVPISTGPTVNSSLDDNVTERMLLHHIHDHLTALLREMAGNDGHDSLMVLLEVNPTRNTHKVTKTNHGKKNISIEGDIVIVYSSTCQENTTLLHHKFQIVREGGLVKHAIRHKERICIQLLEQLEHLLLLEWFISGHADEWNYVLLRCLCKYRTCDWDATQETKHDLTITRN